MNTPYADPKRYRRVDLDSAWHGAAGGLDNISGDTPFHSISPDASHRDRTADVPLVGDPFTHPSASGLFGDTAVSDAGSWSAYYAELVRSAPPGDTPVPAPPDPVALGDVLEALRAGRLTADAAAVRCGLTLAELRRDVAPGIARMVAEATRDRPRRRPPGQQTLFSDLESPPGASLGEASPLGDLGDGWGEADGPLCDLVGWTLGQHLTGRDLRRLAMVWAARARARAAQNGSDPDLPRLLWIRYGLNQRWTAAALAALGPFAGWEHGLAAALRTLHSEVYAARHAHAMLGSLPASEADALAGCAPSERGRALADYNNAQVGAIGALHLWAPTEAHRALTRYRNGVPVPPPQLARSAPAPPTHPAEISEGALHTICRRRGWLTCNYGAEPTYRERALRVVRGVAGRHLPDEALEHWARHGDPSGIIAAMEAEDPTAAKTRWELGDPDPGAIEAAAYLDRVANRVYTAITGEPVVPRTFAAAVFWHAPRDVIRWATRLDRPHQACTETTHTPA